MSDFSHNAFVTSAFDPVGSEITLQLLQAGFRVKGSIKDLDQVPQNLVEFFKSVGTFDVVEGDIQRPGEFDEAVSDSHYIFHTGFNTQQGCALYRPEETIITPALFATRHLLKTATRCPLLKRVIMTSDFSACSARLNRDRLQCFRVNEDFWNTDSTLENDSRAYGKTLVEREAWSFAERHGIDLVTILPGDVMGPSPALKYAANGCHAISGWLTGNRRGNSMLISDVRDVAKSHLRAAQLSNFSGRCIVVGNGGKDLSESSISQILMEKYPGWPVTSVELHVCSDTSWIDCSKALCNLGVTFTDPAKTICDMASQAIEAGYIRNESCSPILRSPVCFGPTDGPRQRTNGQHRTINARENLAICVAYEVDEDQLKSLLPENLVLLRNELLLVWMFIKNVSWLAGRGYNQLQAMVPVEYIGEQNHAMGLFNLVMWENKCDPILSGRDEIGWPKLYCELDRNEQNSTDMRLSAHWEGFEFLSVVVEEVNTIQDLKKPAELRATHSFTERQCAYGIINHKYIPCTGAWGKADVDDFTLTPYSDCDMAITSECATFSPDVSWRLPSWTDMPTQHHIVTKLAELKPTGCAKGTITKGYGAGDLKNTFTLK